VANELRFDFDVVKGEVDFSSVKISIENEEVIPICESYCEGFCGMDYDEDDEDTIPSSCSPEEGDLCYDYGENKGCDQFFVENDSK